MLLCQIFYHSWFYILFVFGVPFATLAVLNSLLVHAVRVSRRALQTKQVPLSAAESKRLDTTVMLIGVVVIFFLCQVGQWTSSLNKEAKNAFT